ETPMPDLIEMVEQARAELERAQTNVKALYKWRNGAEAKLAQLKLAEASRLRCYVWGDDLDLNAIADALADALVEQGFAGLVVIPQESEVEQERDGRAQREHYPTDKCPDPDCAYAQEAASLHVQVSR